MRIAVVTLLALGACSPTQTQQAIVQGQLFCRIADALNPQVVAIADAAGAPVVVTDRAAATIAAICAAINAVPVPPPAAAAPTVRVAQMATPIPVRGSK